MQMIYKQHHKQRRGKQGNYSIYKVELSLITYDWGAVSYKISSKFVWKTNFDIVSYKSYN
jgi:beta-lactamase class D